MATPIGVGFRGTDGRLGYLLRQTQQMFRAAMEVVLGEVGITAAQFSLLSVIEIQPGLTGAELARDSMLTPQSTNELLLALARAGLVDRRPDPLDRRVRRVFLTAAARDVLAETHPRVRALEARMTKGLSRGDHALLRTWLVRAAQELEPLGSHPPDGLPTEPPRSPANRPARSHSSPRPSSRSASRPRRGRELLSDGSAIITGRSTRERRRR